MPLFLGTAFLAGSLGWAIFLALPQNSPRLSTAPPTTTAPATKVAEPKPAPVTQLLLSSGITHNPLTVSPSGAARTSFWAEVSGSASLTVRIVSKSGVERTLVGPSVTKPSTISVSWDGRNDQAQALAPGQYRYELNVGSGGKSDVTTGVIALVRAKRGAVTVAAVGDLIFAGNAGKYMRERGLDYPFAATSDVLQQADIALANMEGALSSRGSAATKQYTFRSPPEWAQPIGRAGFDAVSLANNHILDYGPNALLDTIAALKSAGVEPVGAGENYEAASAPVTFVKNNTRVAVLAFSDVVPSRWGALKNRPGIFKAYSPVRVEGAVREALKSADEVVVAFHWGQEMSVAYTARQKTLAKAASRGGAALVFGHHPHVLQQVVQDGRTLIAYSLGNFVHTPKGELARQSGILVATITPNKPTEGQILPAEIRAGQPRFKQQTRGPTEEAQGSGSSGSQR